MADKTMLARRQIRLAALAALGGPAFAGVTVESPGDWSTPPEALPAILLRLGDERKESIAKSQPDFTTTVAVQLLVRVGASNAGAAQDAIEQMCYAIEQAVLTNYGLISIVNQVTSVDTRTEISSDGQIHFGGAEMVFTYEIPEFFDPFAIVAPPALTTLNIHADMAGTFDSSGVYPNAPFPDAVQASPRASGPDGRDEGALTITLPQ